MLKHLSISNFAIINELELEFHSGMTVFTGETGAGKSILIDALGLVLGDRAEASVIQAGANRSEIVAEFSIDNNEAITELLEEQSIEQDTSLLIRRVINRDSPSRAFINSTQVPAQLLKTLGEHLIDIHGQHEHQSLMKRELQRDLLDRYAGHDKILNEVKNTCMDWRKATQSLDAINRDSQDVGSQLALLEYQVQELDALAPKEDEYDALSEEHKRLANSNRLLETGQSLLNLLHEDDHSLHNQLSHANRELQELQKLDASLNNVAELLNNAVIQLDEGSDELRNYIDRLELDPGKLNEIEQRLDALHDMARKHHIQPQQLPEHLQEIQQQLEVLLNSQDSIKALQQQQAEALQRYNTAAGKLHDSRLKAAKKMASAISKQLKQLGMPDGKIIIEVTENETSTPQLAGIDQIEFQISLNPGHAPQPLRKIASGGELSRISLAIQVICKNDARIPTFIFDEVDAGIGGGVAEIVGNLLHDLAHDYQIFCVTHLPQVAAQGDQHLLVQKSSDKSSTKTSVTKLKEQERIEEIARMLGGIKISDQTRAHAQEMLKLVTT